MAQESVETLAQSVVPKGQRAAKALYIAPLARQNIKKAIAAGVKIALGTDSGVSVHGKNAHEFELMVGLGMKPMDAILAENPLDDVKSLNAPAFVMHEGKVVASGPKLLR